MSEGTLMGGDVAPNAAPAATAPVESAIEQSPQIGQPASAPEWLASFEGIDAEIAGDPSLKAIQDVPSLIKSYVHAQRKMGADKVIVPGKNSTNEEWLQMYHKLGLPTEFDAYGLNAGEKPVLKEDLINEFKKTAYENRLLPEQAQAMYDFLSNQTSTEIERMQQQQQEELNQKINGLKEEWGDAFEQKIHTAKLAVDELGGEDLKAYLNETGLGNDPQLIKIFNKIGARLFQEDNFQAESKPAYSLAPDEAQGKINEILGDFNGAYYNSQHPDHKRMVEEVQKLWKMVG